MYDTWMPEWHNADWVYTWFDNISELPRCGYSSRTEFELEEHKFPWISLAEYIEKWVLRVPETLLYKFI